MGQSVWQSWLEAGANVLAGLGIGFLSNLLVLPWFGVTISVWQSAQSSLAFTVISLLRSFAIRRLFNCIGARSNA